MIVPRGPARNQTLCHARTSDSPELSDIVVWAFAQWFARQWLTIIAPPDVDRSVSLPASQEVILAVMESQGWRGKVKTGPGSSSQGARPCPSTPPRTGAAAAVRPRGCSNCGGKHASLSIAVSHSSATIRRLVSTAVASVMPLEIAPSPTSAQTVDFEPPDQAIKRSRSSEVRACGRSCALKVMSSIP